MVIDRQKNITHLYERLNSDPQISHPQDLVDCLENIHFYIDNFSHLKLPTSYSEAYTFIKNLGWGLLTSAPKIWTTYNLYNEGKFNTLFASPYTWELLQLHNEKLTHFIKANADFLAGIVQAKTGLPKEIIIENVMPIFIPLLTAAGNDKTLKEVNKLIMQFMDAKDDIVVADIVASLFNIANNNETLAMHLKNPIMHDHIFKTLFSLYEAAAVNTDSDNTLLNNIQPIRERLDSMGFSQERLKHLQPILIAVMDAAMTNPHLQQQAIGFIGVLTKPTGAVDNAQLIDYLFGMFQQSDLAKVLFTEANSDLYVTILADYMTAEVGGLSTLTALGVNPQEVESLKPIFRLLGEYLYYKGGTEDNAWQSLLKECFNPRLDFSKFNEYLFAFLNDNPVKNMLKAEHRAVLANITAHISLNNPAVKEALNKHQVPAAEWVDLIKKSVDFCLEQMAHDNKRFYIENIVANMLAASQKLAPNNDRIPLSSDLLVEKATIVKEAGSTDAVETFSTMDVVTQNFKELKEIVSIVIDNVKLSQNANNNLEQNNQQPETMTESIDLAEKSLKSLAKLSKQFQQGSSAVAIFKEASEAAKEIVPLFAGTAPAIARVNHQNKDIIENNFKDKIEAEIQNKVLKKLLINHIDVTINVFNNPENWKFFCHTLVAWNNRQYRQVLSLGTQLLFSAEVKAVIKSLLRLNFTSSQDNTAIKHALEIQLATLTENADNALTIKENHEKAPLDLPPIKIYPPANTVMTGLFDAKSTEQGQTIDESMKAKPSVRISP